MRLKSCKGVLPVLSCALLASQAQAETDPPDAPAARDVSLSKAVAQVSTVLSVRGSPYFGCENERLEPGSQRLIFPCADAHLIRTGDEARAVASVAMSRLYIEQNPPRKEKWHWSEYLLAGAVAAVGEAVDDAENTGLQREEQRAERTRQYEFNSDRPTSRVPRNRLRLTILKTIRFVGSCTDALDSALDRLSEKGSEAGQAWANRARREVGSVNSAFRSRCYTPRRCIDDLPEPSRSGSDTSHSSNMRYIDPVGRPTMVIKCSVQ